MITDDPISVLTGYFERVNRHDVAGALAYLSEGFRLEFTGGPALTKKDVANAMGWDAGTRGQVQWRVVSEDPVDGIVVEGQETNEFLRLTGIGPLNFRSRFQFDDDGLIARQTHEVEWSGPSMDDALAPALAWAEQHAPDELAKAYPDGRLVYSEESGRRWVSLLRRWREAITRG